MPGLVAALHLRYPKLGISVEDGLGEQLVPRLLEGKLDVVVGRLPASELPEGFQVVELPGAQAAVFVRKGHALTRRTVKLKELANWDFIGFAGDDLGRSQSEQFFGNLGLKAPRTILRSSSLESLLTVVSKSDNLVLLSDMFEQRAAMASLERLRLEQPLWPIKLGICFHRQSLELAPMRTLLELASDESAVDALLEGQAIRDA